MAVHVAASPFVVGPLPQVFKFSQMPDWDLEFNKSPAERRPSALVMGWLGWRLAGTVPKGVVRVTVGSACSCGLAFSGAAPRGFIGLGNSKDPIPKVETAIAASVLTVSDKNSLYDAYRYCDESTLADWRAFATPTDLPEIAFDLKVHDTIVNLKHQVEARDDAEQSHLASDANVPFIQARRALRRAKASDRAVARARLAALSALPSFKSLKDALAPLDKAVLDAHTEIVFLLDIDSRLKKALMYELRRTLPHFPVKRRRDIADEVHTDVILKLPASVGSYNEARHGGWRWVKTIIKSEVMSFLRRLGRHSAHVLPPGGFGPQASSPLPHKLTSCWQVNEAISRLALCPGNPVWAGHTIAFLEEFDAAASVAAASVAAKRLRKCRILAFALISVLKRDAKTAAKEIQDTLGLRKKPPLPTISRWNSEAVMIVRLRYLEKELFSQCVPGGTPRIKAISSHLTTIFGGASAAVTALGTDLASAIGGGHLSVADAITFVKDISNALGDISVPLRSVAGTAWPPPKPWMRSGLAIVVVCRRCKLLSKCLPDLSTLSPSDQVRLTAGLLSVVASMQWGKAEEFLIQCESSFPPLRNSLCKTLRRSEELFQWYKLLRTDYPALLGSESGILLEVLASVPQTIPQPAGAPVTAALSRVLGLSELPWNEVTDTLLGLLPTDAVLRNQVADGALCVRVIKLLATPVNSPGSATMSARVTWLANGGHPPGTPSNGQTSIEFKHWFALDEGRRRELLGHFETLPGCA